MYNKPFSALCCHWSKASLFPPASCRFFFELLKGLPCKARSKMSSTASRVRELLLFFLFTHKNRIRFADGPCMECECGTIQSSKRSNPQKSAHGLYAQKEREREREVGLYGMCHLPRLLRSSSLLCPRPLFFEVVGRIPVQICAAHQRTDQDLSKLWGNTAAIFRDRKCPPEPLVVLFWICLHSWAPLAREA